MISLGATLLTALKGPGDRSLESELIRKLDISEDGPEEDEEYEAEACLAWGDERAPDGYARVCRDESLQLILFRV